MSGSLSSQFVKFSIRKQLSLGVVIQRVIPHDVVVFDVDNTRGTAHVLDGVKFELVSSVPYLLSDTVQATFKTVNDFMNYLDPDLKEKVYIEENKKVVLRLIV